MVGKVNTPDIHTYMIVLTPGLKSSYSTSDGQDGLFIINWVIFPIVLKIHVAGSKKKKKSLFRIEKVRSAPNHFVY